jgi:hypothetical protein
MSDVARTAPGRARWLATALVTLALALVPATGTPARAATAALRCSELGGVVAHQRLDGDLVVDGLCEVRKVGVTGDLIVEPAGRLAGSSMTVKGDLVLAGAADLWSASVYGSVTLDGPAATLTGGMITARHSIRGDGRRLALVSARVEGDVDVTVTVDVTLARGTVGGVLTARGGVLDLAVTTVRQAVTSDGASSVRICASRLDGDLTVTGSRGPISLGTLDDVAERCPQDGWDGPLTIAGTLRVHDAAAGLRILQVYLDGDLVCSGTTGTGGVDIRGGYVLGTRSGACAA